MSAFPPRPVVTLAQAAPAQAVCARARDETGTFPLPLEAPRQYPCRTFLRGAGYA
jgi:hypothetical protein